MGYELEDLERWEALAEHRTVSVKPGPLPHNTDGLLPHETASIGFVCHYSRLGQFAKLVRAHKGPLSRMRLIATKMTLPIFSELGLEVDEIIDETKTQSGPEIGHKVVRGELNGVIFLADPFGGPEEPQVDGMLVLCGEHQVPLATNLATAQILLLFFADWEDTVSLGPALPERESVLATSAAGEVHWPD